MKASILAVMALVSPSALAGGACEFGRFVDSQAVPAGSFQAPNGGSIQNEITLGAFKLRIQGDFRGGGARFSLSIFESATGRSKHTANSQLEFLNEQGEGAYIHCQAN